MGKYEYRSLVRRKESIINDNNEEMSTRSVLHVAFGVDEKYLYPLGILMTSLAINNPLLKLHFSYFC